MCLIIPVCWYLFSRVPFVILSSVFLFPGVLRIPVSLVNCFPVCFYLLFSLSVTSPPCSIQFTCVLVFYMFHVFLTSRLRHCFCVLADSVFGSPLDLTFRYSDLCLYFDYDFCLAPIKSFFSLSPCASGSFSHLTFTTRNRTNSPPLGPSHYGIV